MNYELLKEIWTTTMRNKLRTALTGFAVAWGIFMLIFLLGAGNGLINAQVEGQSKWLTNSMMVFGGNTSKPYDGLKEGRSISLKKGDMGITATGFRGIVGEVGGVLSRQVVISSGDKSVNTTLSGVCPADVKINKREMLYGRFVNDIDLRDRRKVVVMSSAHAKELAGNAARIVGRHVKVDNMAFKVVGVYKTDESSSENSAFSSFSTVSAIYAYGDEAGSIEFMFHGPKTVEENDEFEAAYRAKINSNHRAAPDDESAVWLWNRNKNGLQMEQGIGIIRTALWVVGLFTLLSGIVGVSNIMLITVKERTREFGVRKAIGAKPWAILRLIMVESIVITTIFGYVGMVCGVAANEYMNITMGHTQVDTGLFKAAMFVNPTVGIDVCIEATLVMIVAGTVAGLIPARKAARIRPIEALRAE